ncbi:hypothetical protein CC80DRAFT_540745 [Byssothecium circinans]|uniref:RelA/SpoT domain-containing protein n=1 Tax=Byssothecium circinans TaxID=147558 RepID=A0A6A5T8B6_9PLEO|nr:hypothetical protein CC80DRAFT_540745 [Byssothecium circinans]
MAKTPEFIKWVAGTDNNGDLHDFVNLREEMQKTKETPEGTREADAPGFRAWGRDIYEHPDMGDLAGVRIGLFFPGDVAKVAKEINRIFNVSYTFGTVADTSRAAVDGINRDIQRHGNGRWISQDHDKNVHQWEHYGYKSWQVVVRWKRERPLPNDLETALVPIVKSGPLRVEIQVGTVVTQAWAEVQHNIIYKGSNDIQATPTMKRMIDAINGLAITTDIMLMELERCQVQAEEEAEAQRDREKNDPPYYLATASLTGDHEAVTRLLEKGGRCEH